MHTQLKASVIPGIMFALLAAFPVLAQDSPNLKLIRSVELPGYTGDFDHLSVDRQRQRLLVAAEDHATLEVFDLNTGKHLRSISGFGAPHTILVRPGSPTIFVTDSGPSMSQILDADTYAKVASAKLVPGADSAGYDVQRNILYVVTGGKDVDMKTANLEAVDPATGKALGSITFDDNHVEAMALEKNGPRIFINLAQSNKIAVVDRSTMKVIATWPVPPAKQNAMIAFDEAHRRLYVVCRDPGMVVVMNSDTGEVTTTQPAPLRADDVMFDSKSHTLYVPGGEGYIGVYDTSDPDKLRLLKKIPSGAGAKTGILLSDEKRLILAVSPGDTKATAKILTYSIE